MSDQVSQASGGEDRRLPSSKLPFAKRLLSRTRVFRIGRLSCSAVAFSASLLLSQVSTGDQPGMHGQHSSYAPHLAFDVISIHESGESRSGDMSYIDNPPQTSYYQAVRVNPVGLILGAYDLNLLQRVKNVPSWAMRTPYDITAKSDDRTDEEMAKLTEIDSLAEKRHMLQALLADRFRLQIHSERLVSTTYKLMITPRTAKLMGPIRGDVGKTISTCNPHFSSKGIEVAAQGCPFDILLGTIEQALGTDVLDKTGLTGMYSFRLMWRPSEMNQSDESYPSIVDAVREQLGLELKPVKVPVTFWIVDHIERPTPN